MNTFITALSLKEISEFTASAGQPSFRALQLAEWLYGKGAESYSEMTNIPKAFREFLEETHPLVRPRITDLQKSKDGTGKFILTFPDKVCVETVALPSSNGKLTICCSSQAGCAMGCSFCATGKEGFTRNLTAGEIVNQIYVAQKHMKQRVSNVVVMGQGEPFLNYDATLDALRMLNHPKLFAIGARHMTISTCGIIPGIRRLSEEPEQFTLAVSLHAALQKTRDELMPGVAKYPLQQLKKALQAYVRATNRRVTLEYAMISGINDSAEDREALEDFCEGLLCHINLIPLNKIVDSPFQPSLTKTMTHWQATLQKNGIETTIRHSRGSDIAGACGQLKNAFKHSSYVSRETYELPLKKLK